MTKIIRTKVHVPTTKIDYHPNNLGTPHPTGPEPVATPDPVRKLPYRQVTLADGTVAAPSWSPASHDNVSDTAAWNRSYADSQRQLNPAGNPTHIRKSRENSELPAERTATVTFSNGRKHVSYSNSEQPLPASPHRNNPAFTPRRHLVGGPRNPSASVKPFGNDRMPKGIVGDWSGDD
jgi:hypothetical protein